MYGNSDTSRGWADDHCDCYEGDDDDNEYKFVCLCDIQGRINHMAEGASGPVLRALEAPCFTQFYFFGAWLDEKVK